MRALKVQAVILLLLLISACGEDPVVTLTRNLARPGPMAMVKAADGKLYGFVANTATGDIAVFRTDDADHKLLDLDPANPGYGFIPVGKLPSDVKATSDGLSVVVANSGSCDLAKIDVASVLRIAGVDAGASESKSGAEVVSRIEPKTEAGSLLLARPQEMQIIPNKDRAYVTFPNCQLIAEIDLSTGKLLQGLVWNGNDFEFTKDPKCPVECFDRGESLRSDAGVVVDALQSDSVADSNSGVDSGIDDANQSDMLSTIQVSTRGILPYALALLTEDEKAKQLFVSSAGANFISIIEINDSGEFEKWDRIVLSGDKAQTTHLALSQKTNTDMGYFLYAIAREDRSVRVISVDQKKECEVNLDLAKVPDGGIPIKTAACYGIGEQGTPPRRVTVEGSGLRFGSRIPRDVVFSEITEDPNSDAGIVDSGGGRAIPLKGIFAFIALSDGNIYVIDVEDNNRIVKQGTVTPLEFPHRIRNSIQGTDAGIIEAGVVSVTGVGDGGVPVIVSEQPVGTKLPGQGIYLMAPGQSVSGEWYLQYEPRLVERAEGQLVVTNNELRLVDPGANFCAAGVRGQENDEGQRPLQHGDIVVIVGCSNDDECGLNQVCRKSVMLTSKYGLCFDASHEKELFSHCADFLQRDREFLVSRAENDSLVLDLLSQEPQSLIKQNPQPDLGCISNEDCNDGFLCALEDDTFLKLTKGQCFRPGCDNNTDCGTGYCATPRYGKYKVCAPVKLPIENNQPSSCFSGRLHYQVLAGRSFVIGGYRRQIIDPITKQCAEDPNKDPLHVNRIPIGLPVYPVILGKECEEGAMDPFVTPSPNPCFQRITDGYTGYIVKDGKITSIPESGPTTIIRYANPDIAFSLGVGHLTKPSATRDDKTKTGPITWAPMPARGLEIKLVVSSGYSSMVVSNASVNLAFPSTLVNGSDNQVYIVDEGDLVTTTGTTCGQVRRFVRVTASLDSFVVQ